MENAQIYYKLPERFPHWPDTQSPFAHNPVEMLGKLLCYPPLGQLTAISSEIKDVTIRVALEVGRGESKDWQVSLWYEEGSQWRESAFIPSLDRDLVLSNQANQSSNLLYYTLKLSRPDDELSQSTAFTIKFRHSSMSEWKWANGQFNMTNGVIGWQPKSIEDNTFGEFIHGLDSAILVKSEPSQTPETLLWSLSVPVPKATDTSPGSSEYVIGKVIKGNSWFATVRLISPWIAPRHGTDLKLDKDAVQLAFIREDGISVVLLALSGINETNSLFRSDDQGQILIKTNNDASADSFGTVLVAVATSYDVANASVMYQTRKYSQNTGTQIPQEIMPKIDPEPKWYEEWIDGFGYCTWNSLGQDLTEQKIVDALDSFRQNEIPISTLIIDDNWQSLDKKGEGQGARGMTQFEADKEIFPDGLKSAVSKFKSQNPSLKQVAVWHTLLGYWGAISPDGQLAKDYKIRQVQNPGGWKWTCIDPEDISRFYSDFYAFLSSSGVQGVKTDSQNSIDDIQYATDRREMIKAYQDAWTIEGLRHLNARQISCGSQCPVILFHSLNANNGPRVVVRNSDDFFPDVESSHPWHIFCNAHNALLMQHLNVYLDWDMFQTNHPWAAYHAAARCLSGGPIYITDSPGKHDKDLIAQMTALTPQGSTVILRSENFGKSLQPYVAYDSAKLLQIGTYHGPSETGTSIIGVFNVNQFELSEIITLTDFPGTSVGTYIIRSYICGKTSPAVTQQDEKSIVHVDLGVKGFDILSAHPVIKFKTDDKATQIANLGLINKMSGATAVISSYPNVDESGKIRFKTSLKALGTFGIWINVLPKLKIEDHVFATLFDRPLSANYVKVSDNNPNILEMDLEKAWKEGKFESRWSNEVSVQLLIITH